MIKERGRIVAIEPDCLWVETIRRSTCNSCSAQKGCGHGLMNKVGSGQVHHIRVLVSAESTGHYAINDEIDISIPEAVLVKGALIVYMLPLMGMFICALLTSQFWSSDVMVFAGAVGGFVLGIVGVRYHAFLNKYNSDMQPAVIKSSSNFPPIIQSI